MRTAPPAVEAAIGKERELRPHWLQIRELMLHGAVILSYVAVRTRPDPKTGSRYGVVNPLHNFPIQTNHTIGPFSGGLPKPLEVGDSFSAYFPYAAEKTFLADDLKQIGFFDTFHRHHWAPRRDLKNVLAKYKKEIGTVAPTNADLKRDDGAGLVPDITT